VNYPSDLSDAEWAVICPLVTVPAVKIGRPREVDIRRVIDGIFYVNRTGCQWRYLPGDFPK
jgi:putative transposase